MSIEFLAESPPFADDEIVGMAHAVDDVCKVLEIPPEDAPTLKSIAERVVELARERRTRPVGAGGARDQRAAPENRDVIRRPN